MTFKPSQHQVKEEARDTKERRIVKLDENVVRTVENYSFAPIVRDGPRGYEATRKKMGPLAVTDTGALAAKGKDARFHLNSVIRDALSVEEEERRAIEERVRARVQAVATEVEARAHGEGYEAGLKSGYAKAYEKFQEEGKERLERFDAFLAECDGAREALFRANESTLIDLVYRVAELIVQREVTRDPEWVLRVCQEILEKVGVRENIKIKVHPRQLESAKMLKEEIDKRLGGLRNLTVEGSAQVTSEGCIVETEWNVVDARLETQLAGVRAALLGDRVGN